MDTKNFQLVTLSEIRRNLDVMYEGISEKGGCVITKYGKPAAVAISQSSYEKLIGQKLELA